MNDTPTAAELIDERLIEQLIEADKGGRPVEDFFQNPEKAQFRISPDGKWIAWLAPWEKRMNIFVKEYSSDKIKRITSQKERDIPGYTWVNNNQLVYMMDDGGDENHHLFVTDKAGKSEKDLTPFEGVKVELIDDLEDRDEELIIGMNKNNPQLFEPYLINISTGKLKQLAENNNPELPIMGWLPDHNGEIRVALSMSDGVNSNILYRANTADDFHTIITTNFKETVQPLFFTFDNKALYALSNLGRDKTAVIKLNPDDGKEMEVLGENPDYDLDGLHYSEKRKVLTAISYTGEKRERIFLDNETKAIFSFLRKELGNYEIVIADSDKAEEKFIVRTYSDRSLGDYYLLDWPEKKLIHLSEVNPLLKEEEMAEMKPITYKSRDGLSIHGYLTLPKNTKAENLPVVINPHGGPWHRDVWGFNPEVQLLADRGYAVLQMNFRGSIGYGRKFWESSFKQWGMKMQDDISDGVQWLIDEGIADPERIAIYGGSYGGYATLAGIAFTPQLYTCAIDYVGVSNLFTFMETFPPYWKPYKEMMYEMVGNPNDETDKEMMHAASPVFHIDKIQCPLFVVQGAKDPRVNIEESNQIVKSLKEKNIEVPYLVKENEGHGFRNEENRFEFYRALCGFLKLYL
ncbi:MAG: S9 family peptidase [Chitinophagales bacterium]